MALRIPGLPDIFKSYPRVGEALQKIENYTTLNVVQAAGTVVQPPPVQQAPIASASVPPTITPPIPKVPPPQGGSRLINQS